MSRMNARPCSDPPSDAVVVVDVAVALAGAVDIVGVGVDVASAHLAARPNYPNLRGAWFA